MKKYYKILHRRYGNHTKAALGIGLHPRYYRAIRRGEVKAPRKTALLIRYAAMMPEQIRAAMKGDK